MRPVAVAFAAFLLFVSLVAVGTRLMAQAQVPNPSPNQVILSGSDVGFRVNSWKGNVPVGQWVVRVDGRWIEPEASFGGVRRLTAR